MNNIFKKIWRLLFPVKPKVVIAPIQITEQIEEDTLLIEKRVSQTISRQPRSMTEKEKELYKIKPNLQYWIEKGNL